MCVEIKDIITTVIIIIVMIIMGMIALIEKNKDEQ